jgi:hypothetical protein
MKKICYLIGFTFWINLSYSQVIQVSLGSSTNLADDFLGYNGANFLRADQPNYDTQWIVDSLATLYPSTVRYPAGLPSNYWDWRTGNFIQKLKEGWILPKDFGSIKKTSDYTTIRTMLEGNAAVPMLSMNILCSSKENETAGLMFANSLNIPVKYIEFGSELYHDRLNYLDEFPSAESYATRCNEWAAFIKSIPGFQNYKVAAVGAQPNSDPAFSRRNSWTKKVTDVLNSNVDAITLHYYNSGRWGKYDDTEENLHIMFQAPFEQIADEKANFDMARAHNKEVWITEYNHYDRGRCLHDTWAHGLFLAAQTLTFLEDTVITKALCHTITTDARMGCLFNDSNGLIDFENYKNDANCNINAPYTRMHEKSAGGTAISMIGKAMLNATSKKKLNFDAATPLFLNGYQMIYGWQFESPLGTEAIILNLDSVKHSINFNTSIWNLANGKFEQIYPGPNGPLEFIVGNPVSAPGQHELTKGPVKSATQKISLPAWSITRIWVNKAAVIAKATKQKVSNGSKTTLRAFGNSTHYTWSGAQLNLLKPDGSLVEFKSTNSQNKTYKIQVTDASGITSSTQITVHAKPVVTASATSTAICKGNAVTLSASLTGGNSTNTKSFVWVPSENVTNANQATCVAKPVQTTTYTVYATDGNDYTAQDTVTITVGPDAIAGSDQYIVSGTSTQLTAQNTKAGTSYKWYLNNSFLGNISVNVAPIVTSTYTLVARQNSGSCTDTDYVTITPLITCASALDTLLTIPPNFTVKQFVNRMKVYCNLTGNGMANDTSLSNLTVPIYFNGPFIIDNHYTFINCTNMYFSEGSYILQNTDNKNLSLYNCQLKAAPCTQKMWRGIVMQEYGEKLILNNCLIEDAINGVEATNNTRVFAINTTFKRCYIGIYYHDFDEVDLGGEVYGCKFVGTKCTLAPYLNQNRLAGIYCKNAYAVEIGKKTGATNIFNKSLYGIYAQNTSISLFNSSFSKMRQQEGNYAHTGSCVYMKNGAGNGNINNPLHLWPLYELFAGDTTLNAGNSFKNSNRGIVSENCAINAVGNLFDNVNLGVNAYGCVYKILHFKNNQIINSDNGFLLVDNKQADINLMNNNITIRAVSANSAGTYCVRVADASGFPSTLNVEFNYFTSRGIYALLVSNNKLGNIESNTVYMDNTAPLNAYGIKLEACDSMKVNCNYLYGGTLVNYGNQRAISLSFTPNSFLECNETHKTGIGFEFLSDCNFSYLKNNTFRRHKIGISVGSVGLTGGLIGPQPPVSNLRPLGNMFAGEYTIATGVGKGKGYFVTAATQSVDSKISGGLGTLKQFIVYEDDAIQSPYPNIKIGANATALSLSKNNKVPLACNANCSLPEATLRTSNVELPTASDYASLKNQLAQSFTDDLNDVMQYHMKIKLFSNTTSFDLSEANGTDALKNYYRNYEQSNIGNLSMLNKAYGKVNGINTVEENNSLLNDAARLIYNVTPENEYALNAKQLEQLKIDYFLSKRNDFDNSEIQVLYHIASLCPYTSGPVVFDARALYAKYHPEIIFDDFELCKSKEPTITKSHSDKTYKVQAYPNPTDNILNLSTQLDAFKTAALYLYDVTGRMVFSKNLNTNQTSDQISLGHLENGYYNYTIIADGNAILNGKIGLLK